MTSVLSLFRKRFSHLTEIQKKAMPLILKGDNVLLISPTGTGKTEAAFLPILEKIADSNPISPIKIPLRCKDFISKVYV